MDDRDAQARLIADVRDIWDAKAAFWDEHMGEGNQFQLELIGPSVERLLAVRPGERVLDVGCGTGTLAIDAKRRQPEAEMAGLDADPAMLERARRKARDRGVELELVEGFSDQLPFAEHSFDVVLSSLFFHHLERPAKEATARELVRVLRPGGRLHVADWGAPDGPLTRALSTSIRLLDGDAPTRDNLSGALPGILEDAGLARVRERASFHTPYGRLALLSAERPPVR
jgi:SAM-dependent methyltransferase